MLTKFRVRDASTNNIIGYERINENGHWEHIRENRAFYLLGPITSEDKLIREAFSNATDNEGNEIYESDRVLVKGRKRTGEYMTRVIKYRYGGLILEKNETYLNDYVSILAVVKIINE